MKKTRLTSVATTVLMAMCGYSQAPQVEWQRSFGGSYDDRAYAIQQTGNGGFIVAGYSESINGNVTGNHGSFDYWVVKLESGGDLYWQRSLGGSFEDYAHAIQETNDGGFIGVGRSRSNNGNVTGNHGSYDYWVVKLNGGGALLWQRSLGGSGADEAYAIQQTSDDGFIVAGRSNSTNGNVTGNHGGNDYWVVKLNGTGDLLWQRSLGGSSSETAYSIRETSDGGFIVAGVSNSNDGDVTGNHGMADYWVVRLDSVGDLLWQRSLGGSGGDLAYAVQVTSDGGFIVAGVTNSNDGDVTGNHGSADYWVVKLDADGDLIWQRSMGGSGYDEARSIQQTSDGGFIVAGFSDSNDGDVTGNHGGADSWVVKLDGSGDLLWQLSLGGSGFDEARSIQETSDGGFIVAGSSTSNHGDESGNHGDVDVWVVKLSFITTAMSPSNIETFSISPNPSSGWFKLELSAFQNASLSVVNVAGQEILREDFKNMQHLLDLSDRPLGIYMVTVRTARGVFSHKLILE